MGIPGGTGSEAPACQSRRHKRRPLIPGLERSSLEEGMATHSSILAWRIPWAGEPGRLQSIGSQKAGHDWGDLACSMHYATYMQHTWHKHVLQRLVFIRPHKFPSKCWFSCIAQVLKCSIFITFQFKIHNFPRTPSLINGLFRSGSQRMEIFLITVFKIDS